MYKFVLFFFILFSGSGEPKSELKPEQKRASSRPSSGVKSLERGKSSALKGDSSESRPTTRESGEEGAEEGGDGDDSGRSFSWNVYSGLRFNLLNSGLGDSSPPSFSENQLGFSFLFGGWGEAQFADWFSLSFSLDIGELSATWSSSSGDDSSVFGLYLNGTDLTLSAEDIEAQKQFIEACKKQAKKQGVSPKECEDPNFLLQESFFIRELYSTFSFGGDSEFSLEVGIFNRNLGRSFIMDNYVLGLRFDWDRRESEGFKFRLLVDAFLPDSSFTYEGKRSPTFQIKFSYLPLKNLKFSLYSVYMYDGDNLAGKLLLPLWRELYAIQVNAAIERRLQSRGISAQTNFSCEQVNQPRESDVFIDPKKGVTSQEAKLLLADIQAQSFDQKDIQNLYRSFPPNIQKQATSYFLAQFIDLCTSLPSSSGHHFWLGFEWEWNWKKKLSVEGSFIFYASKMSVGRPQGALLYRRTAPRSRFIPKNYHSRGQWRAGYYWRMKKYWKNKQQQQKNPLTSRNYPQQKGSGNTDLSIEKAVPTVSLTGLGFSSELYISYKFVPEFQSSLFFLLASGDRFQRGKNQLFSFMGISPYIQYTDLFFSGGINSYTSRRGIGISGIAGTGYISPGVVLKYKRAFDDEETQTSVSLTGAVHWSFTPPPYHSKSGKKPGTFYGGELNLVGSHTFRLTRSVDKWVSLAPVVQFDLFFPGNFFAASSPPPVVIQLIAGLDFSW